MQRALAASIGLAEKWMTKENVLWLPFFGNFRQRNHPHVSAPALFLPVSTNVFNFHTNFTSFTHFFYSWSKLKRIRTVRQYSGSLGLAHPRGMYYNGKEGREEPSLITSYNTDEPATYRSAPPRAERVIKATRCDWLLATTNVDFARTLHNFRLTDSIFESVRRLLSWSGQQHTNVLATLRPAYITQLWGVKPGVHTNDFFRFTVGAPIN